MNNCQAAIQLDIIWLQRDAILYYERVLRDLGGNQDRSAQFVTFISLILTSGSFLFEVEVHGIIAEEQSGNKGFGYDPIFIPDGYAIPLAGLPAELKNRIRH